MPLWRDPLEELIGELERTVPSEAGAAAFDMPPPFEDFQLAVHACLQGSAEDPARAGQDPRIQAVYAYYARLARHHTRSGPALARTK